MIRNSRAPSRWGFSTLGCPELDLAEATALADRFQMHHMELRALENTLDIAPILQAPRWAPLLEELPALPPWLTITVTMLEESPLETMMEVDPVPTAVTAPTS